MHPCKYRAAVHCHVRTVSGCWGILPCCTWVDGCVGRWVGVCIYVCVLACRPVLSRRSVLTFYFYFLLCCGEPCTIHSWWSNCRRKGGWGSGARSAAICCQSQPPDASPHEYLNAVGSCNCDKHHGDHQALSSHSRQPTPVLHTCTYATK